MCRVLAEMFQCRRLGKAHYVFKNAERARRRNQSRCICSQKICLETGAFEAFANFKHPENDGTTVISTGAAKNLPNWGIGCARALGMRWTRKTTTTVEQNGKSREPGARRSANLGARAA